MTDAWLLNYKVLERYFSNPSAISAIPDYLIDVIIKHSLKLFIDIKYVVVGFISQKTLDGGHHDLLINRRRVPYGLGAELVSRLDF